jgi:hypothetical protein
MTDNGTLSDKHVHITSPVAGIYSDAYKVAYYVSDFESGFEIVLCKTDFATLALNDTPPGPIQGFVPQMSVRMPANIALALAISIITNIDENFPEELKEKLNAPKVMREAKGNAT